jgi:hypothetical protein
LKGTPIRLGVCGYDAVLTNNRLLPCVDHFPKPAQESGLTPIWGQINKFSFWMRFEMIQGQGAFQIKKAVVKITYRLSHDLSLCA